MVGKPSVLFVIPGDIERQTGGSLYNRKLIEGLRERGFRLEVVEVPDLPYLAGLVAGLLIAPWLLLRLARRTYDVVIVDGWTHHTTLLLVLTVRVMFGVPLVIVVHQVRSQSTRPPAGWVAKHVEPLALGSSQLIIAVSRFVGAEVERLLGANDRVVVAPPGSAPILTVPRNQTRQIPLRLLFVGNCVPVKGLDHLIEALALIRDLPVVLDVAGAVDFEPPYYRKLVRQANASGVGERIVFHGAVTPERVERFYLEADIFVLPSLYEGFGIVLAEAMQSGLPIIATRTGAADEILLDGENALIVPVASSQALAEAIRRLAGDRSTRERFGRRSRELASSLPTWKQTSEIVSHRIEAMIRTSPDTTRTMKEIPRR